MLNKDTNKTVEQLINQSLKAEPKYVLSFNFANKVILKVQKKQALKNYLKEFLLYFGVILGIVVIPFAIFYLFNSDIITDWVALVLSNITLIAGILFILVFILFADKVLLRYFSFSLSLNRKD